MRPFKRVGHRSQVVDGILRLEYSRIRPLPHARFSSLRHPVGMIRRRRNPSALSALAMLLLEAALTIVPHVYLFYPDYPRTCDIPFAIQPSCASHRTVKGSAAIPRGHSIRAVWTGSESR